MGAGMFETFPVIGHKSLKHGRVAPTLESWRNSVLYSSGQMLQSGWLGCYFCFVASLWLMLDM